MGESGRLLGDCEHGITRELCAVCLREDCARLVETLPDVMYVMPEELRILQIAADEIRKRKD